MTRSVVRAAAENLSVDGIARLIRGSKANGYADGVLRTTPASARTVARTLINGVANNVRLETIRANDDALDGVRFVGTLDGKTCPFCASLDGKIWTPEELDAVRRPPLHMNCRCCVVPHVELRDKDGNAVEVGTRPAANADFDKLAEEEYNRSAKAKGAKRRFADLSPSTRLRYYYKAQKDFEARTGKPAYRKVVGKTTFKEYFEKQDDAFKRSWLGARRYESYRNGALKLDDVLKPAPSYRAKLSELNVPNAKANVVEPMRIDGKSFRDALQRADGERLFGSEGIEANLFERKFDEFIDGHRSFEKYQDAERHIKKKLNIDADYSNIPIDAANAMNRELIRARNMFGTCGIVEKIANGDKILDERDFSGYNSNARVIFLRSDYGEMRFGVEINNPKFNIPENYFSTNDPNHIFRHEIGHALYNYLKARGGEDFIERSAKAREFYEYLIRHNGENLLSIYGMDSVKEMVAEGLAEYMNNDNNNSPRPAAIKIVNIVLRGVFE